MAISSLNDMVIKQAFFTNTLTQLLVYQGQLLRASQKIL
mgnify:CR=1 FL=1